MRFESNWDCERVTPTESRSHGEAYALIEPIDELRSSDRGMAGSYSISLRGPYPSKHRMMSRHRRAFSLIEFTVVLALMALIASIVTVSVRHFLIRGKQNAARIQISHLRDGVDSFYSIMGRYPANEEGLEILTKPTDRIPDPALERVPLDPWSHAYVYTQPGRTTPYEIISLGADGREGGSGGDMDISSADLRAEPGK